MVSVIHVGRVGRACRVVLVLALAAGLSACQEESAPFQARFAVRGRWPGRPALAYRLDAAGGALAPIEFRRAMRRALEEWQETGCASFHEALADESVALSFAWGCDGHDDDVPFGSDPGIAHAGPVAPGTFVHFDPEREWDGDALERAALHEIGHVLGLDHSPDEADVMYPEPSPSRAHLGPGDLAGIHSLYGGGDDARCDLVVTCRHSELSLRQIAPPGLVDWTLFDSDGDGDTEIVTWRMDEAGRGALWIHHFARGPVLERTVGPLYGLTIPGQAPELRTTASGERLLILRTPSGATQVRAFDERGLPQLRGGKLPASVPEVARRGARRADLDGDGVLETVRRRG